jgi:hypothetical protein
VRGVYTSSLVKDGGDRKRAGSGAGDGQAARAQEMCALREGLCGLRLAQVLQHFLNV